MSSSEDIIGVIASLIQWAAPSKPQPLQNHPVASAKYVPAPNTSNILVPFSRWKYVGRSPTLADPANIREFLHSCLQLTNGYAQLYKLIALIFLILLASTGLVAVVTNLLVPKSFRRSSAWKGIKASPISTLFLTIFVVGQLDIVRLFPELATSVEWYPSESSIRYQGVVAQLFTLLTYYEILEVSLCLLLALPMFFRHILHPRLMGVGWMSIAAWIVRLAMSGLRLWFTRVSVDTATDPVQIGTYYWTVSVMSPQVVLWTEKRFQTPDEYDDDLRILIMTFVTLFSLSSTLVWPIVRERYVTVETEPEAKVPLSADIVETLDVCAQHPTDGPCFNSFLEMYQAHLAWIQRTIDEDMEKTKAIVEELFDESDKTTANMKREMQLWRKRHLKAKEMDDSLSEFRENQSTRLKELDTIRKNIDADRAEVERLGTAFEKEEQSRKQRIAELEQHCLTMRDQTAALQQSAIAFLEAHRQMKTVKVEAATQFPEPTEVPRGTSNVSAITSASKGSQATDDDSRSESTLNETASSTSADSTAVSSDDVKAKRRSIPGNRGKKLPAPAPAEVKPKFKEIGNDLYSRVEKFDFRTGTNALTWDDVAPHVNDIPLSEQQEAIQFRRQLRQFSRNTHDRSASQRAQKLAEDLFIGDHVQFTGTLAYLPTILAMAEASKSYTETRIFTELGPHGLIFACGVAPRDLGIENVKGCTWETYLDKELPRMQARGLVPRWSFYVPGQERPDINALRRILYRYIGTRKEMLSREVLCQEQAHPEKWDHELIARRILENLGLLKYREKSWGLCPEEIEAYRLRKSPRVVLRPLIPRNLNTARNVTTEQDVKSKIDHGSSITPTSSETTSSASTPVAPQKTVEAQQTTNVNASQSTDSDSVVPTAPTAPVEAKEAPIRPTTPESSNSANHKTETDAAPTVDSNSTSKAHDPVLNSQPALADPSPVSTLSDRLETATSTATSTAAPTATPTATVPVRRNAVSVPWALQRAAMEKAGGLEKARELEKAKELSPPSSEVTPVSTEVKETENSSDKVDRLSLLSKYGMPSNRPHTSIPESPSPSPKLRTIPFEHVGFPTVKGDSGPTLNNNTSVDSDGVSPRPVDDVVQATTCNDSVKPETSINTEKTMTSSCSLPPPVVDNERAVNTNKGSSAFNVSSAFTASNAWPSNSSTTFTKFSAPSLTAPDIILPKTGTNFRFDVSTQFDFSPTTVRKPSTTAGPVWRVPSDASDAFSNIQVDPVPVAQPVLPTQSTQVASLVSSTVTPDPIFLSTTPVSVTPATQDTEPIQTVQPTSTAHGILPTPSIPSASFLPSPMEPVQPTESVPLAPIAPLDASFSLVPPIHVDRPALPFPIQLPQPAQSPAPIEQSPPVEAATTSAAKAAQVSGFRPDWRKEALANSLKMNSMGTPTPPGQPSPPSGNPQQPQWPNTTNPLFVPPVLMPVATASTPTQAAPAKPDWRREALEELAKKASFAPEQSTKPTTHSSPSPASSNKSRSSKRKSHGESRRNVP
ncbi:hypothetical protein FRC17_009429 [Serendipita sp. 399]|nr:hypothetical protein FRC17_009429 [Serendipita sp. 399]